MLLHPSSLATADPSEQKVKLQNYYDVKFISVSPPSTSSPSSSSSSLHSEVKTTTATTTTKRSIARSAFQKRRDWGAPIPHAPSSPSRFRSNSLSPSSSSSLQFPWARPISPESFHATALALAEERKLRMELEKKLEMLDNKKAPQKPPWRKILYEEQGYPDNYTPETFLDYLPPKAPITARSYWKFTRDTFVIIQRATVLVLFFTVFYHMLKGAISHRQLLLIDGLSLVVVGLGIIWTDTRAQWHQEEKTQQSISRLFRLLYASIAKSVKHLFFLTFILFAVSPVLATLTSLYCDDTIFALTFVLSALHLVSHDYKYIANAHCTPPPSFDGTISFNAAIFMSVLLASRLRADMSVFAFMLFAFEVHGGFPVVAHHIRQYSETLHGLSCFLLFVLTLFLLYAIKPLLALIYGIGALFIFVLCPFWLKRLQRYKNEIHGPWDYDDEKEFSSENL